MIAAKDVDLAHWDKAISELFQSGIVNFLRERSRTRVVHDAVNYALSSVKELGRSQGYQECLDDLLAFKQRYLGDAPVYQPAATYGGLEKLVFEKRITQEEADELRKQFTAASPAAK